MQSFLEPYEVYKTELITKAVTTKTEWLILQHFKHSPPLKVVPSVGNTPFQTFLPILEILLECTYWDGRHVSCRIILNLLYVYEMTSFQSSFDERNRKKAAEDRSGVLGGWTTNKSLVFRQITVSEERYMSRLFVMVQHPSVVFSIIQVSSCTASLKRAKISWCKCLFTI